MGESFSVVLTTEDTASLDSRGALKRRADAESLLMDKSIALRTAMTEEQAIYRCYFYDHGESFDGEWVEIASGEKPVGKITMCTFPGLRRLTMNEGKKQFMPIVKATAKLDTAS